MSLYVDIAVNDTEIAHLVIKRVESHSAGNGVHSYKWVYSTSKMQPEALGWVDHRFDDGALALIGKAIEAYRVFSETP